MSTDTYQLKKMVGQVIASRVKDGDHLGIGTGTTSICAIEAIGERIKNEGLRISCIATSNASAICADSVGISVLEPTTSRKVTWGFDGADEVDPRLNLIKGRHGAILTEKIVARKAEGLTVIVSEEKLVPKLGATGGVIPIELVPEARDIVTADLKKLGAYSITLRNTHNPFGNVIATTQLSEHGNLIVDARFYNIEPQLELEISAIVGVIETGLFVGLTRDVLVAKQKGVFQLKLVNNQLVETQIA